MLIVTLHPGHPPERSFGALDAHNAFATHRSMRLCTNRNPRGRGRVSISVVSPVVYSG